MSDKRYQLDRRNLLGMAISGAALAAAPPSLAAARRADLPLDVGRKFFADGRVHPFAGNTIICHLPQQGEHAAAFDAMLDIYREAPSFRFMRKVALLPPSSYHMTIFGGANDQPRLADTWPADLPLDMPIEECSRLLGERLKAAGLHIQPPIRMEIEPDQHPVNGKALTFLLRPVDDGGRRKLADFREQLADILKIRPPSFDAYRFHISLGYPLAWLTPAEESELRETWSRWARQIAVRSPVITFGAPEYCTFKDMYAFRREFYLGV